MATKVIDALIVTLGLDATNYKKGSNEAVKQLGQTRSAVVKSSNEMGKAISGAARSFALAFVGFNTASGLVRMLTGLNEASRQLGILAKNTGNSTQDLKNWGNAFAVAGGSAESFYNTIAQIQARQASQQSTGVSGWETFLNRLGVGITKVGSNGVMQARGDLEVMKDLANSFQRMARESGQPFANSFGLQMDIDQKTMTVLIQGADAIEAFVKQQSKLAQNAEQLAQSAARLRAQWVELQKRAENLASVLLQKLQPAVNEAFKGLLAFGEQHGQDAITGLTTAVNALSAALTAAYDIFRLIRDVLPELPEWMKGKSIGGWLGDRLSGAAGLVHQAAEGELKPDFSVQGMLSRVPGTWQANRAKYIEAIRAAEAKHGIPAEILEGIAQSESGWDSSIISGRRKSSKGATGLMQLMPQFFPGAGKDPNADIETGAAYLKQLYKQFGDWEQAAAAYNAGPGTLNAVRAGRGGLPTETANYVTSLFGAGAAQRVSAPVGTGTVLAPSAAGAGGPSTTIGTLNIYPSASTGEGVRLEAARAIERRGLVNQSDYGVRP